MQFNVQEIGEGNYIISMTCNKKNGAMSSICEVIDYIDLKIITSNVTTVSGSIMFTLTVQVCYPLVNICHIIIVDIDMSLERLANCTVY